MGDRANVIIKSQDEQVCLYTHWNGPELPEIVKYALKRGRDRWDDFQYLTRIVFCEMVRDDVLGTTGFGITQKEHDGGLTVHIDCDRQTVQVTGGLDMTFADYVSES